MKATIFDIKHYAIHDGPGIRQTIFFKGCPLDCWWCHNPESRSSEIISVSKEKNEKGTVCDTETVGRIITIDDLMTEIGKDIIFFEESGGGVTLSGGEPLAQFEFVSDLLKKCKERDIHTCIDTSGFVRKSKFEAIAPYTDLFLYDIKHIDDNLHRKYTGVSNRIIIDNLKFLDSLNKEIWIRYPLIPGVNNDESDIFRFMAMLSELKYSHPISVLPYHKIGSHKYAKFGIENRSNGFDEPDEEEVRLAVNTFNNNGFKASVGG